jgi:hypothetical protein
MAAPKVGSICALVAAFAVCDVAVEPAHARFSLWPQFTPWWGNHPPRHKHPPRDTNSRLTEKAPAREKGPLQIIISIADQRISVYDGGTLIADSSVSTGVPDHPTPSGVFSVIGKQLWHRSNLYSDAPMPYMQRITWSGIALHAGDLPGYPASHGCIRLKRDFAIRLWHLTKRGTRVIIAPDDVRPIEIADPRLPQFKPKAADAPPKTAAVVLDSAMTDATAVPVSTPADDPPPAIADIPGSAPPRVAARKPVPISILVSRKSNQVFVRQGGKHLFDAPITIQDAAESLGTHVFTLAGSPGEGADFRWTVVSIPEGSPRAVQSPTSRRQQSPVKKPLERTPPDSSSDKASAALGRIELPPDVIERIADLLAPGSSLIVTDQGISKETGNGTDFIVETR